MATWPDREQAAPNFWDAVLKTYVDEGDAPAVAQRALPVWGGEPAERTGPFDAVRSVYNWKSSNTARFRAGLTRALGGGKMHALTLGDSTGIGYNGTASIEAQSFPHRAITTLASLTGAPVGGSGIVPAATVTDRWAFTGDANPSLYPGILTMNNGATATYTSVRSGTAVTLYYSNLSAAFTFRVDGGAVQNVTPNGTAAVGKQTVTGLSNAVHTVLITAPAGYIFPLGVEIGAASGLVMHNMCLGGTTAAIGGPTMAWTDTSSSTSVNGALKGTFDASGVDPDLLVIVIGGNDLFHGDNTAHAIAGAKTMRQWYPNADCIMVNGWRVAGVTEVNHQSYLAAKYALADELNSVFIDWQLRTGTLEQATARGVVSADGVHPTAGQNMDWGRSLGDLLAT